MDLDNDRLLTQTMALLDLNHHELPRPCWINQQCPTAFVSIFCRKMAALIQRFKCFPNTAPHYSSYCHLQHTATDISIARMQRTYYRRPSLDVRADHTKSKLQSNVERNAQCPTGLRLKSQRCKIRYSYCHFTPFIRFGNSLTGVYAAK